MEIRPNRQTSIRTNGRTTFALNHNPRHAIAASQAMAVHGPRGELFHERAY